MLISDGSSDVCSSDPVLLAGAEGPDVIIRVMVAAIEAATEHPMSRKVLQDEGQWMGRMVTRRLDDLIDQGVELSAPFLAAAMDAGASSEGRRVGKECVSPFRSRWVPVP